MRDKTSIRKEIRLKRQNLSTTFIEKTSKLIFIRLLKYLETINYKSILFYMPITNEVDTRIMFQYFWDQNINITLPTVKKGQIVPVVFNSSDAFIPGPYNIPEPKIKVESSIPSIDIIIVPGIVFDKNKNRIGFGKGFYDQFLKKSQLKIALAYDFQILDSIPSDPHDIKLDIIISEKILIN